MRKRRGSSKSQRSRRCPRTQEPQGDCNQKGPPPPSRGAEDRPGGPQPAAGRAPGDISGKPTGPPATSHPLAGRARDPATRDPGATTSPGDPAEPRDPDPTRQPPGLTRQAPNILNPLTREPRTLRQTKAPHPTPSVTGEGGRRCIACSPYTPYSLWSRYCCTLGTTITGYQSLTLSAGVLVSRLPRPTPSTATHHPRPQPDGQISLLVSSPRKPSNNRGVLRPLVSLRLLHYSVVC
ncbi:basic proline-rich protein-like [Nothobranchius furzeri]|uniref:basic proline-rich protein-like n=1 Tax=Nothobranchius furzeri TaxID=105023 RepID=UPI003904B10D